MQGCLERMLTLRKLEALKKYNEDEPCFLKCAMLNLPCVYFKVNAHREGPWLCLRCGWQADMTVRQIDKKPRVVFLA